MRLRSLPTIILLLSTACTIDARTRARYQMEIPNSRDKQSATSGSWDTFFTTFKAAVTMHDRDSLRGMMSPDFIYSFGGNADRDEAFAYWDKPEVDGWRALANVLAKGTAKSRDQISVRDGKPILSRIAPPKANRARYTGWRAIFEFSSENGWRCVAFVEGD